MANGRILNLPVDMTSPRPLPNPFVGENLRADPSKRRNCSEAIPALLSNAPNGGGMACEAIRSLYRCLFQGQPTFTTAS